MTFIDRMITATIDSYLANRVIPPGIMDRLKRLQAKAWLKEYLEARNTTTEGYVIYRDRLFTTALNDQALIGRFREMKALPSDFGVGIDERCVEYPWVLSRLPARPCRVLDAGSTFNFKIILDLPALQDKDIHIVTLSPERDCFWKRGVSYIFHDLRDLPIRDEYYDVVVSISTIEHVGCDNTLYSSTAMPSEDAPSDFLVAMRELRRVLKPGGTLLFTVPFGVYRHLGWMQQFDRALLHRAIREFGQVDEEERVFYRYSAGGWDIASEEDCQDADYVASLRGPHAQWPRPLPIEIDNAARARAVACVRLVKSHRDV